MQRTFKVQSSKFKVKSQKLLSTVYCLLLTVYCFLSACATTENLDLLREDVSKLQGESLLVKNELNSLKEKTSTAVTDESLNAVRQNQVEMQSLLSNLSRDLQVLSGRFDENKYFTEKELKNSVTEIEFIKTQLTLMEGRIKEIKDKLGVLEGQMKQQKEIVKEQQRVEEPKKEPKEEISKPKVRESKSKATMYEEAYDTFKKKRYKEAREKFDAFIKEFPKDELTDNAQFWIAETYYGEKDFEGAILAYEALLKKYPNSQKAPTALLKQGFSFIEIGDKKTGKVILEQLRERYPDSKEAELAKKKVEEIEKKTRKKKR